MSYEEVTRSLWWAITMEMNEKTLSQLREIKENLENRQEENKDADNSVVE